VYRRKFCIAIAAMRPDDKDVLAEVDLSDTANDNEGADGSDVAGIVACILHFRAESEERFAKWPKVSIGIEGWNRIQAALVDNADLVGDKLLHAAGAANGACLRADHSHDICDETTAAALNRRFVVVCDVKKDARGRAGRPENRGLIQTPMHQQVARAKAGQVGRLRAAAVVHQTAAEAEEVGAAAATGEG
jgi:hypothetical protein